MSTEVEIEGVSMSGRPKKKMHFGRQVGVSGEGTGSVYDRTGESVRGSHETEERKEERKL